MSRREARVGGMMPRKPQPIGALIPALLRQADRRRSALGTIRAQWRPLLGRALAAHTSPVSLRGGRLVVQAEGPGDSFALSYHRPRLIARLRELTAGQVEEIVIRPAGAAPAPTARAAKSQRTRRGNDAVPH